jgi:ubiquinone/menaquinone biosynthesis C-methylase UbiE
MAEDFTTRLLVDAGINTGMRVLDVSLLLAHLMGENGLVVGVDLDARPLAVARERAQTLGPANVRLMDSREQASNARTRLDDWSAAYC